MEEIVENRWSEIENRGNLGMPAGRPGPRGVLPWGSALLWRLNLKEGQQDLKVVPTPNARPGDKKNDLLFGIDLDTSKRIYLFCNLNTYMCS